MRAQFLKEYCLVLKPLARSLDILQGGDNCFYGTLLPTLETIIKKLLAVKPNLCSMAIGLPDAIEEAITDRFRIIFQNDSAIIAAITLPSSDSSGWITKAARTYISKCLSKRCDHINYMLQIMKSLL